MRRALLYLVLVFILTDQVIAQDAVTGWFPVHVGDKWIYEHETRNDNGGGIVHLEIHRWITEETTIGSWTIPEGTLVGRQVRVTEGSPPADWREYPPHDPASLIRGNCLYVDGGSSGPTAQLSQYALEGLSTYLSPDFCFPLDMHKTWGAPHGLSDWGVTRPEDAKDWEVAGVDVRDSSAPDRRNTFHITSISGYPGSGIMEDIWFKKGVGVVRDVMIHRGTIGEERTRLVRFEPAPQN